MRYLLPINIPTLILILPVLLLIGIYNCPASPVESAKADSIIHAELIKLKLEAIDEDDSFKIEGVKIHADQTIRQLYEANKFGLLWKRKELYPQYIEILQQIKFDGLLSQDYDLSIIRSLYSQLHTGDPDYNNALCDLDIITTNSFLLLTLHMLEGKSEPNQLDPNWNYNFEHIDKHSIDDLLEAISSGNLKLYFNRIRTRSEFYLGMYNLLIELHNIKDAGGWTKIDYKSGTVIKPGERNDLVASIRQRLHFDSDNANENDTTNFTYDSSMVASVTKFQETHGLSADGVIGPGTLSEMNVPVEQRIDQVRVNLERVRWLINDIIEKRVLVNIASFEALLIDGQEKEFDSKVMVGKPYHKTPVFESTLGYVEFNPTWTVPRSIIMNEMLPKIKSDPNYLSDRNMELLTYDGKAVSRESVNFDGNFPYMVRQGPGPGNALGRVKFIFPNSYSVYLHDTPSRYLFDQTTRAFSHGCIRLENPLEWAELILDDEEWNKQAIDQVISSGKTTRVYPESEIRIMIVYLTHITRLDGTSYFYPDIYDRDQKVLDVLNSPIDDQILEIQVNRIRQNIKND